jgi:hypothetical protein
MNSRIGGIMSELAIWAATIKTALRDIGKQAAALGTGLQNAAPGDKSGMPNNSVQYLTDTSEQLDHVAEQIEKMLELEKR